jgi:hypothetical protein
MSRFPDGISRLEKRAIMFTTLGIFLLYGVAMAAPTPLTPEVNSNATGYMEWLLDVSFNGEQRQQYGRILEDTWRSGNKGAINGVLSMAGAFEKLSTLTDNERAAKREKMQAEFVRLLRTANDSDSKWLLGLYESAHASPTSVAAASSSASGGALSGRWTNGRISMIQYQNAYTGVAAPTNGNSFAYEFHADGTYSFTGLMQSVMYNCTTAVFSHETGTYTTDGSSVSLKPEKNPYKMTNSCAPSSNRESPGKLINKTYRFRVVQDAGGPMLELTGTDGGVQKFQRAK